MDLKRKATATARLDSATKISESDNHKESQKDKGKGKGKGREREGDRDGDREGERGSDKEGEYDMVVVSHLDENTCDEDEGDDDNMGVEGSTGDNDVDNDNDCDLDADADDFLDKYEKTFQSDKMNVVNEIKAQGVKKHETSEVQDPVQSPSFSPPKSKGLPVARNKVDHKGNNNSTYLAALALTSKLPTKHNTTHANICPDLPGVLITPSTFAMYGQKGTLTVYLRMFRAPHACI